ITGALGGNASGSSNAPAPAPAANAEPVNAGSVDVTINLEAASCASEGTTVDGAEFAGITASGDENHVQYAVLGGAHLAVTGGDQAGAVDELFEVAAGHYLVAVGVDDGNVIVTANGTVDDGTASASGSGTLTVRDAKSTWTCARAADAASCTSA